MRIKKVIALFCSATLGLGLAGLAGAPAANAAAFSFANNTGFVLTTVGTPSQNTTITQFGMSTTITDVNVTLNGLNHTFPDDLDIELIGPNGTAVALMSDTCGATDIAASNFTFDDASATSLTDGGACVAGTYKPSAFDGATDNWFTTPTATALAAFNGTNPNGTWRVYASDDTNLDGGGINGGWSIQITTAATAPITMPSLGVSGSGPASPYPVPIAVSGLTGPVTDVNVTLTGLAHTFPDDLDMLLVSPGGAKVVLMSDACGGADVLGLNLTFDDSATTAIPDGSPCAAGTYRPADYEADAYPAPAPAGPYSTTLAAFNGASGNGTWNLFIFDDAGADGGWLAANPTLTIKTSDVTPPQTTITRKPKTGFKTTTKIKFSSDEPGSVFECKVDSKPFKPCASPLKLKHLTFGKHKIQVRAIDASGNVDTSPAKAKWKILKKR